MLCGIRWLCKPLIEKKMQIPIIMGFFLYFAEIIPSHLALSLTGYLLLHCAADIKLLSVLFKYMHCCVSETCWRLQHN